MKRRPRATNPKSVEAVVYRSGGLCEANIPDVCPAGPHRGEHPHHICLRARGGTDEPENLLHVCWVAHRFIHNEPRWSTANGFMRSKGAA